MLDQYLAALKLYWLSQKRYARSLPDQIPEEVVDDYHVGVFNKTQARLSQITFNVRGVSQRRCLNSDDYNPRSFTAAVMNACRISSQEATDNYISLQKLKEAERAAREANEVSIAGQIWDVIGWDSPTDFLVDAVFFVASGGASKVVKWGERITRLTKRASKAATKLERLLVIEKRAHRMEQRIIDISRAATRLKKANKFVQLPRKIALTFETLKRTRKQLELAELIGKRVTKDYIRSVASSVLVKSTGMTGSVQLGKVASKELARASILSYLDGTQLGAEIKELRSKINYTLMIAVGFNSKTQDRLMAYFGLFLARELIARLAISVAHKRDLTVEQFANEFIDSAGSALETMLLDVPIISKAELKFLGRKIMSTIRKFLAEIAKKLAQDLLAP